MAKVFFFPILFFSCAVFLPISACLAQPVEYKGFRMPKGADPNDYINNTIIFKIKPEFSSKCFKNTIENEQLQQVFKRLRVKKLGKKFPEHTTPGEKTNKEGESFTDLSLIYELEYTADLPLAKAINNLIFTGSLIYAEPSYVYAPMYVPNDPQADSVNGEQYYLRNIRAYEAWDIHKGDTGVVVGIVDTGVDTGHADLKANIKYNYADPPDGDDNDNDGFKDNYAGWDLADNDGGAKHPGTDNASTHGTGTAGQIAAATNNSLQAAGVSFNCKFLPVKATPDNSTAITEGYTGIIYSADHGATIINCSWGGDFPSEFGQDAVNYATINKGALVIAASGNKETQLPIYPAGLDYVLNVAGTDINDIKFVDQNGITKSNFGAFVDLCAPGKNIYSLATGGSAGSGTSASSSITSGSAALVKSKFSYYSGLQVGQQLKVTCDFIDTITIDSANDNKIFAGKLGYGRINLFKAVTDSLKPSMVMTKKVITDSNDNDFIAGDTVSVSGRFTNYLAPTAKLSITISAVKGNITILNDSIYSGIVPASDTTENYSNPFTVLLNAGGSANDTVLIKINYYDTAYYGFEYIEFIANRDITDIKINNISTSVTSDGRIGFADQNEQTGLGFYYKGQYMLYEAGVMIGASGPKVSDNVRGNPFTHDDDFTVISPIKKIDPPVFAHLDATGIFNDDNAGTELIDVKIIQSVYAWNSDNDSNFVIIKYKVINDKPFGDIQNLYIGIFADWDIMDFNLNRVRFDASNRMGYAFSSQSGSPYSGIKLLSNDPVIHYAIDAVITPPGGEKIRYNHPGGYTYDSISTQQKYTFLSTNRSAAGDNGGGNDIIHVVSSGPFNIIPKDTVEVVFAIVAGDNLNDLFNNGMKALAKFDTTLSVSEIANPASGLKVYPNPANDLVNFDFIINNHGIVTIFIYDLMGQMVYELYDICFENGHHSISADVSDIAGGVYFYRFFDGTDVKNGKIVLVK